MDDLQNQIDAFRERLIFLCMNISPSKKRYAYLQKITGVNEDKWKNLFLKKQQSTVEMILKICEQISGYETWLITGEFSEKLVYLRPPKEHWESFKAYREWRSKNSIVSHLDDQGGVPRVIDSRVAMLPRVRQKK